MREAIAVPRRALLRDGDQGSQASLAVGPQFVGGPLQAGEVLWKLFAVLRGVTLAERVEVGHVMQCTRSGDGGGPSGRVCGESSAASALDVTFSRELASK